MSLPGPSLLPCCCCSLCLLPSVLLPTSSSFLQQKKIQRKKTWMIEADKVLGPAPLRPFCGLPSKDLPYTAPKLFKVMPSKLKFQAITWNSRCNPLHKIVCCNASSTNSQCLQKIPLFFAFIIVVVIFFFVFFFLPCFLKLDLIAI